MRVLLAFFVLVLGTAWAVPVPIQPPKVQAEGHFNTWTIDAKAGALVARQAGKEIWRRTGPFDHPTGLQLWVRPPRVLLLSADAYASNVFLSAYELQTGRQLWENRLFEYGANAAARVVDSTPDTLLIQASSGEPMFGKVIAVDIQSGKTRWNMFQDFLGHDGKDALLVDFGVGSPTDHGEYLPLWRVNIASGQKSALNLTIPVRSSCGKVEFQVSIPDVRFTNRYLYVFRKDSCGKFIARYDWHAPKPEPLIYPDQRPPMPNVK